jgi:hypothetical protein
MAPEVFTATASYSEKADIFSAAVCMVHLITGEEAYDQGLLHQMRIAARPDMLARKVALNPKQKP